MEVREFSGCFLVDGRETDVMALRVVLSTGGGRRFGSGDFPVPAALAGLVGEEPLTFRLDSGEELVLVVREFDLLDGRAYFLTEGAVPAGVRVA